MTFLNKFFRVLLLVFMSLDLSRNRTALSGWCIWLRFVTVLQRLVIPTFAHLAGHSAPILLKI